MTTPLPRDVAVLLDMENLFGGHHRDVTSAPVREVVRASGEFVRRHGLGGLVASARAYSDWSRPEMGAYRRAMLESGVEPVQVFSFGQGVKNAADMEMVVDALRIAADCPWVGVFVLATGDAGFVPLVRRLHALGKHVVLVSTTGPDAGGVSPLLRAVVDHHHVVALPQAGTSPAIRAVPAAGGPPAASPPPASPPPASAGLHEYRSAALRLVAENPAVLVDGAVHGSRLGTLLRRAVPHRSYTDFGYRSLAKFVEEGCGLRFHRP
ncbi:NYN domain-containing protein [Kocuria sp. CPCC 205268]|uniref:NYN domain-containing protein n=1 Tax=Kocuria oxytropis TaxID=3058913 RepID=UPI0034D71502